MVDDLNTQFLRKRRQGWFAVVTVPKHLREKAAVFYGSKGVQKKEVVRGLNTRDLTEANRLKWLVISAIRHELDCLERGAIPEALEAAQEFNPNNDVHYSIIDDYAHKVANKKGFKAGEAYFRIATKQAVPISIHSVRWFEELLNNGLKLHTINDYKATLRMFIDWCDDVPVQDVDRTLSGLFTEYLKTTPSPKTGKPLAVKTLKKKITALSSFWAWLDLHGFIKIELADVWLRQFKSLSKIKKKPQKKRALTIDEARKWLNAAKISRSKYSQAMVDMLILGWHTGARAEDLCSLTSTQLLEDAERRCIWIHITDGKTDNNERLMPVISPEALAVLRRRKANTPDDTLFPEIEPDTLYGQKYTRLQKAINPLRIKVLGNEDIDFHSLRRAFSIACERAGTDPVQWARLMGHALPTLASSVYNRGHKAEETIIDIVLKVDPMLGELTQ